MKKVEKCFCVFYRNASFSSSSLSASFIFFDIIKRNSLNSIVPFPLMSTSFTILRSSFSVIEQNKSEKVVCNAFFTQKEWNKFCINALAIALAIDDELWKKLQREIKNEKNVLTTWTLSQWTHNNTQFSHSNRTIFIFVKEHKCFFEFCVPKTEQKIMKKIEIKIF